MTRSIRGELRHASPRRYFRPVAVVTTSSPVPAAPPSSLHRRPRPLASPAARRSGPASHAAPPAAPPSTALSSKTADPQPTTARRSRPACRSTAPHRWPRPVGVPPPPSSARSPQSLCAGENRVLSTGSDSGRDHVPRWALSCLTTALHHLLGCQGDES